MNRYEEMNRRHRYEVKNLPIFFAFSNEQFEEGMKSFGLAPNETDKIFKLDNTGGYYRRDDAEQIHGLIDRQKKERNDAIQADATGDGFIFDMFLWELEQHEFVVTGFWDSTLRAIGMNPKEVEADARLLHGLKKAARKIYENAGLR